MQLSDLEIDVMPPVAREASLVEALRSQIAFMRDKVPFWRERFSSTGVDEGSLRSLDDLAKFPILEKKELRATPPAALLVRDHLNDIEISRWTSGTSGRPTVSYWARTDWAALVVSTARMLARHAPVREPSVFNGYSQAHLTGPLYHAALQRLGGTIFDRSHHPEDVFSTLAQAELFEFDTLVLPERSTRGKSIGLVDLLVEDPHFLVRHGVRWWLGSSGTFDSATVERVQEDGVRAVTNLYGASEFGLFAVSCTQNATDFHVAQGHVLVEVVDALGAPVDSGQAGRVIVTHLAGMGQDGHLSRHLGSQIFRLAGGDAATIVTEPCRCGLTTPRLRNITRTLPRT